MEYPSEKHDGHKHKIDAHSKEEWPSMLPCARSSSLPDWGKFQQLCTRAQSPSLKLLKHWHQIELC